MELSRDRHMAVLRNIERNLRRLMDRNDLKQVGAAKRCKVGQRTISYLLTPGSRDTITLDVVERVAHGFGMPAWALMLPLPDDLLGTRELENVVDAYIQLPRSARSLVKHTIEREQALSQADQANTRPLQKNPA